MLATALAELGYLLGWEGLFFLLSFGRDLGYINVPLEIIYTSLKFYYIHLSDLTEDLEEYYFTETITDVKFKFEGSLDPFDFIEWKHENTLDGYLTPQSSTSWNDNSGEFKLDVKTTDIPSGTAPFEVYAIITFPNGGPVIETRKTKIYKRGNNLYIEYFPILMLISRGFNT